MTTAALPALLREALGRLGIERLSFAIHERCLPADGELDVGCGAPGGQGATDFLSFVEGLGFTLVQLGPPGQVSLHNLSPYDSTAFSRAPQLASWSAVAELGLVSADELPAAGAGSGDPGRCDDARAFAGSARRWAFFHERWEALEAAGDPRLSPLAARLDEFSARAGGWLRRDGLHGVLSERLGTTDTGRWPAGLRRPGEGALASLVADHALALRRFAREQWVLLEQHRAFRTRAKGLALEIWGDLQAGLSHADRWAHPEALLPGFLMGAPPSRTNPLGQPWGYAVLDPSHGPDAAGLLRARSEALFREYDGVRIDHPHALVCPWVYRAGEADPYAAVRAGGRLHSIGPGRELSSALAPFDFARPEQLDARAQPWADAFVVTLDDDQVDAYAWGMDMLVAAATAAGRGTGAIACEVLSTLPYPLRRVLERHGLGRFRVTSKADVTKADDVYLMEASREVDWAMTGTHDTPPLWHTARSWSDAQTAARRAWVVSRLAPDGAGRAELERHFATSRDALAQGEQAVLFTGRARNVLLWWSDVLGEDRIYNRPGEVHPENWTLRVPPDFRAVHDARVRQRAAFDPAFCLALALLALPRVERDASAPLIRALAAGARTPVPGLVARLEG